MESSQTLVPVAINDCKGMLLLDLHQATHTRAWAQRAVLGGSLLCAWDPAPARFGRQWLRRLAVAEGTKSVGQGRAGARTACDS